MENPPEQMDYELAVDLPSRLYSVLKSGEWSDCSFVVGTEPDVKVFKAHKMMLSLASPAFRAMFNGELAEKSPIPIVDIRPEIFQFLLNFIYTDQCILESFEQARDVCYAADKYLILKLIDVCEVRVLQVLNAQNACQAYEMAKYFNRLDLMQRSLTFITENINLILNNPSFKGITLSTLLMILNSDALALSDSKNGTKLYSDIVLLNPVMIWGVANFKRKEIPRNVINVRKFVDPALRQIRFLTFTESEFTTSMQQWKILTKDEQTLISKNILKQTTFPMVPLGFSTSRVRRIRGI